MTARMNLATQRGFTLLEMVCVLAIIALLAAVLLPFIPHQTSRSRLQAYALQTATLLKADRNAAIERSTSVATLVDAREPRDPFRRVAHDGADPRGRAVRCGAAAELPASGGAVDHPFLRQWRFLRRFHRADAARCRDTRFASTGSPEGLKSLLATSPPTDRAEAGFTIIEVLVALALVAVSIVAIGAVMGGKTRGVRALEQHVALMQAARTLMTVGIPPRAELQTEHRRPGRRAIAGPSTSARSVMTGMFPKAMCPDAGAGQNPRQIAGRCVVRYPHRTPDAEVVGMNPARVATADARARLHADRDHRRAGADGAVAVGARQHHGAVVAELEPGA